MDDSIQTLTDKICVFRDERDWKKFHNPKELAVAIVAEAGELLQHFVWQSPEQSDQRIRDRKEEIGAEMADVAILLFELARDSGIDLAQVIDSKLARNAEKYPISKAKGSNKKYSEL
jgi:dCTP diphosphatase